MKLQFICPFSPCKSKIHCQQVRTWFCLPVKKQKVHYLFSELPVLINATGVRLLIYHCKPRNQGQLWKEQTILCVCVLKQSVPTEFVPKGNECFHSGLHRGLEGGSYLPGVKHHFKYPRLVSEKGTQQEAKIQELNHSTSEEWGRTVQLFLYLISTKQDLW